MSEASTKTAAGAPWVAQVSVLVAHAQEVMSETQARLTLDTGNGPYAFQLLYEANRLLDANTGMLRAGTASDYYNSVVLPAHAMVLGARDMSDVHRALKVMLDPAAEDLSTAAEILNRAEGVNHG